MIVHVCLQTAPSFYVPLTTSRDFPLSVQLVRPFNIMSLEILGKSQTTQPVYSNGKAKERNIIRNVYTIRKRAVHERDFPQPLEFSVQTISFERVTFAFLNVAFYLVISFSVLIIFLHTTHFSFT